ncbi:MAG: hypothetical protein P8Y24_09865 [Gammaproteobacteria bacterium]
MKLFNKSESIIDDYDDDVVYAEFANLAATYKAAPKNDLKKETYFAKLEELKRFPVRLLEEGAKHLKSLNHYDIKPARRLELARAFAGYLYPVVAMWFNKYQAQESSTPESNERKAALVASINVVDQLTIAYKHVFRDLFDISSSGYKRHRQELQEAGFRILELIRLEQRLRALRYQRLPKTAWQNSNQVIFSLLVHNDVKEPMKMMGSIGYEKKSDVLKQSHSQTNSIHDLYCSIQLFGLLDLNTWPIKLFHVPDMYLQYLDDAITFLADNGQPLVAGTLITFINNDHPPMFKRRNKMPGPCILLNYAKLYNTLVRDHEELAKMEFIKRIDPSKLSRPLLDLDDEDRIPVLELILVSLKSRERQQKRHAVFAEQNLRVYFGCKDVNKLMADLIDPDVKRVMAEREFVDTLAQQSAMVADDDKKHMNSSWRMMNFSAGGMLIGTEESSFNSPIQIGQMVAVSPADDVKKQTIGYVCRIVRPHDNQIEVAITRIANHVEASVVQTNEEVGKNTGHASLLMNDGDGKWHIALSHKTGFVSGMPLKLTRGDGSKLPVRLGEVWMKKRDFTVFELRSPGLKH